MRSILFLSATILAASLAACSTQQEQKALTVACTVDKLAPALVAAGTTIALIADPATVAAVSTVRALDAAAHPAVQAACTAALPGSVPVAGTVNPVSVPVAPPVSQTTAVIVPVSAKPQP